MSRLTRRELAHYAAEQLINGNVKAIDQIAGYLLHERRVKEVDLLVSDIESLLAERGLAVAHVSSAYQLDESTKQSLTDTLKHKLNVQKLHINHTVKPELLGGFKVRIAGREIDMTLARKIEQLKRVKV